MGVGHVPQDPAGAEGAGAHVQGRERRGTAPRRAVAASLAATARGRWGEDLAAAWYRRCGGEVIARNWRAQGGELDLIVRLGEVLVVAEVKARASDRYGGPALAVGPTKQRRIRRLTAQWLAAHPWRGPVRFDVVAITGTDLRVIKGAW